jgi:hypothetical protein
MCSEVCEIAVTDWQDSQNILTALIDKMIDKISV